MRRDPGDKVLNSYAKVVKADQELKQLSEPKEQTVANMVPCKLVRNPESTQAEAPRLTRLCTLGLGFLSLLFGSGVVGVLALLGLLLSSSLCAT